MLTVYLTRHGQTVWNTEVRMQGRNNSVLTTAGIEGARHLAEAIRDIPFSRCYTSPMPRAVHTSLLLLQGRPVPLVFSGDLAEMDLGDWEGLSMQEATKRFPENFFRFRNRPDLFTSVGEGESFFDVVERARHFLASLERYKEDEGPVLCVTHCILLQAIIMLCEKREMSTLRSGQTVDQTTLFRLAWDGHSWHVTMKNIAPDDISR